MKQAASADRTDWTRCWYETYRELGGRSKASGNKACPRAAAYGLWFLGRISQGGRPRLNWPVSRVVEELGRNAAYAVIAAELYLEEPGRSLQETWQAVRLEFRRQTGEEAARSEQGEVRVTLALSADGCLS